MCQSRDRFCFIIVCVVSVKVKFAPEHAMMAQWGSGGIVLLFL